MNNCEKYEELCSAELDNTLNAEEKQGLDAHLAVCPSCRAYLEDLREMRSLWKELEVPVPKDLHEKMMGAIEAEVQKTIVQTPQKNYRRPPVFTMLAAAAACVMLAVSGNLTGLFGQIYAMPIKNSTKEPLPATAEVPKTNTETLKPIEQQPQKLELKPEIEPGQVEAPQTQPEEPKQPVTEEKLQPKPEQPKSKAVSKGTPQAPAEQPISTENDGVQVPVTVSEGELRQAPGNMGRATPAPVEPYAAIESVPAELSQMQFARCYDVKGGTELPVLDDMTLLVTQDGISYYSVENNESKIVQVQQELIKSGFELTLNEVSGISIQRMAKTVLLIVHVG